MESLKTNTDLYEILLYVIVSIVFTAIIVVSFFYYSRQKLIQKEIEKHNLKLEYQKALLNSIIITQEVERKRIAQDLHDDISSKLNIVSLNTHLLETHNLSEVEIKEISSNIINLTQKALESSRRIAHDLYPPVLEKFGLEAGIKELCHDINKLNCTKINFSNSIALDPSKEECQLHIFRILQELINNSIRHGKATEININLFEENTKKKLSYSDNGIGFDTKNTKAGLGLKNIESRISVISGSYIINSRVNKGMKIEIIF
jgi:signal transduction histidine kinase